MSDVYGKKRILIISNELSDGHIAKLIDSFSNFEISVSKTKTIFEKSCIELSKIDKPKEKHFEKFNYKYKRGKKKWR